MMVVKDSKADEKKATTTISVEKIPEAQPMTASELNLKMLRDRENERIAQDEIKRQTMAAESKIREAAEKKK